MWFCACLWEWVSECVCVRPWPCVWAMNLHIRKYVSPWFESQSLSSWEVRFCVCMVFLASSLQHSNMAVELNCCFTSTETIGHNKHFHTGHGQNTSTQDRSVVSQWHSHTHTHSQACANDCLTKYSSLLVEWQHKTTACIHGMHSSDDPQETWKEPTDWKICGCQKNFFFFQLHNFH